MIQTFFIDGPLPGFNEFINAARGPFGTREYTKLKQSSEGIVVFYARKAKIQLCQKPVRIEVVWREPTKRRDHDNVQAGVKVICDGLRAMGALKNDTWRWVTGISQTVEYDSEIPGVLVRLIEEDI